MSIRITTYNVLSPNLCTPEVFQGYPGEVLEPENRLEKLKLKLQYEIKKGAIVCLQEVSYAWAGPLQSFFAQNYYHLLFLPYGHANNGYMGVCIAFPYTRYYLLQSKFVRVGDHIPLDQQQVSYNARAQGLVNALLGLTDSWNQNSGGEQQLPNSDCSSDTSVYNDFSDGVDGKEFKSTNTSTSDFLSDVSSVNSSTNSSRVDFGSTEDNPWTLAARRTNAVIVVKLQDKATEKVFCLATYHMPCFFFYPQVMVIHAAVVTQLVQSWAERLPLVLAGDFNFDPTSAPYRLLTTGTLDECDPAYPPSPPQGLENWKPTDIQPMVSAYARCKGREPHFTNFSQMWYNEPFHGTLDYIFCSTDVKVESVLGLRKFDGTVPLQPNYEEPSDHLLISATVSLPRE